MCFLCESVRLVDSLLLSILLIWSYGSKKRPELTLGISYTNVALGRPQMDVSMLLLKSLVIDPCLWLLQGSCFLAGLFLINNASPNGNISNFLS